MRNFLMALAGIVALIPGANVFLGGKWAIPPIEGADVLFTSMATAGGGLAIAALFLYRKSLRKRSKRYLLSWALRVFVFACICVVVTLGVYDFCVVTVSGRGRFYFPIVTSGGLSERIERAGGRAAAVSRYGAHPVQEDIDRSPTLWKTTTTTILLATYSLAFCGLCASFMLVAIRQEADGEERS